MFNVRNINFAHGAMTSHGKINGAQVMVMESQQKTDKLIEMFEAAIRAGYNPDVVYYKIFDHAGYKESDLTDFDKERLRIKIRKLWQSNSTRR